MQICLCNIVLVICLLETDRSATERTSADKNSGNIRVDIIAVTISNEIPVVSATLRNMFEIEHHFYMNFNVISV